MFTCFFRFGDSQRIRNFPTNTSHSLCDDSNHVCRSGNVRICIMGIIQLFHEGLIDGGFYGKGASFFHGGNALLRVNEKTQRVETSKGIFVSFVECKRLWVIVNRWHNNGTTFTSSDEKVHSTTHDWDISRYQDDIMIAGCHAIHYSEMEYAARQLGFIS